jgi:3-hydroxybutyryl-CoA dehydrogenase
MVQMTEASDFSIGIVGAGIMGRGIAQVAAEAGIAVVMADARPEAVAEALTFCRGMINRKADKGTVTREAANKASALLNGAEGADFYESLAGCDLVIEAVAERIDIKHQVVASIERVVSDDCIIATNTSSLSVTSIAAGAAHPQRVAGFHFFNPVPLMRLVEVIGGVLTDVAVLERLDAVARRMGHRPVRTTDTPGFLVNHAGRAFGTEALRIVSEGIATFADVDRVMREAAGFRLGPFELFDLTGLDVSHAVIESIYRQYYEEPRYRPVAITAQRHAAGLFGRKTGRGFYVYQDGKAVQDPEHPAPPLDATMSSVWVSDRFPKEAAAVRDLLEAAGARVEPGDAPSDDALILFTPFGSDTTTCALHENVDPRRSIAIDCLLGLDRRRTLMRTPVTDPSYLAFAHALFAADGTPVTTIHDSPGFVTQRILATIVNIGSDIAQQRIATPDDINEAIEIALGYPRGPLRFGDELGAARILSILEECQAFYGDPRYRASPWLKRRALLGVPLTTAEG